MRLLFKGIQTIALPRKIVPRLGLGFGSSTGLVLGLGAPRQLHLKKIVPRVGLGFGLGLVLGLAAIFLEGSCPRTLLETSSPNIFIYMLSNIGLSQRMYVCVLVYILATITLELQSSLSIYTKHMLHTFIFFFFIFFIFLLFADSD